MGLNSRVNLRVSTPRIEPNPSPGPVPGNAIYKKVVIPEGSVGNVSAGQLGGAERVIAHATGMSVRERLFGRSGMSVRHLHMGWQGSGTDHVRANVQHRDLGHSGARGTSGVVSSIDYQTGYVPGDEEFAAYWHLQLPSGVEAESFAGTHHILMNYIDVVLEGDASAFSFERVLAERGTQENWVSINGSEDLTPIFDVFYNFANHMAGFENRRAGRYASDVGVENVFEFAWARNYAQTKVRPAHTLWRGLHPDVALTFDHAVTCLAMQVFGVHAAYPRMKRVEGHRKELADLLRLAGGELRLTNVGSYLQVALENIDRKLPSLSGNARNDVLRAAIRGVNDTHAGFRGMKGALLTQLAPLIAEKQRLLRSVTSRP